MKRGCVDTDTHTRKMPCEDAGRDQGDASTSQGIPHPYPQNRQKPPELGESPGADSPSRPSEGTRPDDTLILDFWPPEPWENRFLSFNPLSLQYLVTAVLASPSLWVTPGAAPGNMWMICRVQLRRLWGGWYELTCTNAFDRSGSKGVPGRLSRLSIWLDFSSGHHPKVMGSSPSWARQGAYLRFSLSLSLSLWPSPQLAFSKINFKKKWTQRKGYVSTC